jgi:sporulation protein YlmC with PRC-barrel domain
MPPLSDATRVIEEIRTMKPFIQIAEPRLIASLVAALLMAAPFALEPRAAQSQAVHLVEVDVKVAAAGYRASKLIGQPIVNDEAEDIGKLDEIILGPDAKANYAIIEVGGFLGLGSRLVAVPFESLKIDKAGSKIVLPGASKTALKKLTEFKYG